MKTQNKTAGETREEKQKSIHRLSASEINKTISAGTDPVCYWIQQFNTGGKNWIDLIGLNPVAEMTETRAKEIFSEYVANSAKGNFTGTFRLIQRTDQPVSNATVPETRHV